MAHFGMPSIVSLGSPSGARDVKIHAPQANLSRSLTKVAPTFASSFGGTQPRMACPESQHDSGLRGCCDFKILFRQFLILLKNNFSLFFNLW